ncbi:MAG: thioredoxin family protein [Betaproteobacteria bacterium]
MNADKRLLCPDSGARLRGGNDGIARYLIAAWLLVAALTLAMPARAAEARDADQHFFDLNTGDLRAEARDAKQAGKKAILFMFEQEGCPGCLYMKTRVLNRADVQAFYRQRFVNFSVDIFGAVPIRDFAGRDLTEKSYAQVLRVTGTPTFVFYDLDGNEVIRLVGPVKEPAEFILLGEFVSSGAYRSTKFADYKKSKARQKGS